MQHLVAESFNLLRAQSLGAGDVFVASRILGNKRALADDGAVVFQRLCAAEVVDIVEQSPSRDANEWVLDSKTRGNGRWTD